jgi:hypothetical protein
MISCTTKISGIRSAGSKVKKKKLEMHVLQSLRSLSESTTSK